jgi:elongation factor Ts
VKRTLLLKHDDFVAFVNSVAAGLLNNDGIQNEAQLLAMPLEDGVTVDEIRRGLISKLGENITIRRFEKYHSDGGTACYLHGTKIGVIVELAVNDLELGKDVAMHIAASKPVCVSEDQVPQDIIEEEKEIFRHKPLKVANLQILLPKWSMVVLVNS